MSGRDRDEFYVGYLPKAPAGVARFLRVRVIGLIAAALIVGAVLRSTQGQLGPSVFEFGEYRVFEGVIIEKPYPMLALTRPGQPVNAPGVSRYFITVFGKYGAEPAVAGLDGKRVRLEGALIYRDDQTMLELKDGSIQHLDDTPAATAAEDLGQATLVGEIVDSKCFLGVMNPGNLKTHKACAIHCIRGGVPPVLLVRDADGRARYFLLTDEAGGAVNDRVLDLVAEPVRVTGRLKRLDNLYVLQADPASYQRL